MSTRRHPGHPALALAVLAAAACVGPQTGAGRTTPAVPEPLPPPVPHRSKRRREPYNLGLRSYERQKRAQLPRVMGQGSQATHRARRQQATAPTSTRAPRREETDRE